MNINVLYSMIINYNNNYEEIKDKLNEIIDTGKNFDIDKSIIDGNKNKNILILSFEIKNDPDFKLADLLIRKGGVNVNKLVRIEGYGYDESIIGYFANVVDGSMNVERRKKL